MDKYSIITMIAIIVIVIPFAYSGINVVGAKSLELGWQHEKPFRFFEMTKNENMIICNKLPIPITVSKIEVGLFFEGNQRGSVIIDGETLNPGKNIVPTKFNSDFFAGNQYLLMEFDSQLNGESTLRHDLRKFIVNVRIDTPIIGVIPYSISNQVSGADFMKIMRSEISC